MSINFGLTGSNNGASLSTSGTGKPPILTSDEIENKLASISFYRRPTISGNISDVSIYNDAKSGKETIKITSDKGVVTLPVDNSTNSTKISLGKNGSNKVELSNMLGGNYVGTEGQEDVFIHACKGTSVDTGGGNDVAYALSANNTTISNAKDITVSSSHNCTVNCDKTGSNVLLDVGGNHKVKGGKGNDVVYGYSTQRADIQTGDGDDKVHMSSSKPQGSHYINTGSGNDTVTLGLPTPINVRTLNGFCHHEKLQSFEEDTANNTIVTGSGNDKVILGGNTSNNCVYGDAGLFGKDKVDIQGWFTGNKVIKED